MNGPGASFDREWPRLARRLERVLARRGVERTLREDVVQETGARVYSAWTTLDHGRPLLPWATTVALNLVRDHIRRDRFVVPVAEWPTRPSSADTEVAGLARVELQEVVTAFRSLRPAQRRAIMSGVEGADEARVAPPAVKMARMRARRALAAAVGRTRVSTGVALAARRWRTWVDWMSRRAGSGEAQLLGSTATGAAMTVAVLVAVSMSLGPAVPRPEDSGTRGRLVGHRALPAHPDGPTAATGKAEARSRAPQLALASARGGGRSPARGPGEDPTIGPADAGARVQGLGHDARAGESSSTYAACARNDGVYVSRRKCKNATTGAWWGTSGRVGSPTFACYWRVGEEPHESGDVEAGCSEPPPIST